MNEIQKGRLTLYMRLREKTNREDTFVYYKIPTINTNTDAIDWLYKLISTPIMSVHHIFLIDKHNAPYASTTCTLTPDVNKDILEKEINTREIDAISVCGIYNGAYMTVGMELDDYTAVIITSNNGTITEKFEKKVGVA